MGHQGTSAGNRPVPLEFPVAAERLSSWKEVAAFFRKDVRTVRRWEAERGLPIHRGAGAVGKSSIFAYADELEDWLRVTAGEKKDPTEQSSNDPGLPALSSNGSGLRQDTPLPQLVPARRMGLIPATAAFAVITFLVSVGLWFHFRQRSMPKAVIAAAPQPAKQSSNPEAQDLYLRGRYLLSLRTGPSINQSIDLFTQAIVRDPQFAAAYSGLADSYILVRQFGHMPDAEAYPRALAATRQAISLDPSLAAAHCSYAFLLNYWQWDFASAESEFRHAIALDPNDAQTHHWYATSLFSAGRFEDALKEIDVARSLDPDSIAILASRGLILKMVDPEAARVFLEQLEKSNPQFPSVHMYLSQAYEHSNDWSDWLRERELFASLSGDTETLEMEKSAGKTLKASGTVAMYRSLAEGLGRTCDEGKTDAMTPAFFYARLGNAERTVHYLAMGFARHEPGFLFFKYEPAYKFLETNRDYQKLLLQGNTRTIRKENSPDRPVS